MIHAWYWHPRGWHLRWKRVDIVSGSVLIRQIGPWRSFSRWLTEGEPKERRCPDGGRSHHHCTGDCWRRKNVGPLSGVFPNDEWPVTQGEQQ